MKNYKDLAVGESIELHVIAEDFENSGEYHSCTTCLLATASKRQFDTNMVLEGINDMTIINKKYEHRIFLPDEYREAMASKQPFSITLTRMYN